MKSADCDLAHTLGLLPQRIRSNAPKRGRAVFPVVSVKAELKFRGGEAHFADSKPRSSQQFRVTQVMSEIPVPGRFVACFSPSRVHTLAIKPVLNVFTSFVYT
jgi:hypothetical protein